MEDQFFFILFDVAQRFDISYHLFKRRFYYSTFIFYGAMQR